MNTVENQQIVEFVQQQKNNAERIEKLEKFLSKLEEVGISVDADTKEKMSDISSEMKENEKLRVVLVGGFSEGKTSIAAAWLGDVDVSMKISEQESSDEVKVYHDEYVDLVDTPGLFGFKEKFSNDIGKVERYKDITKRYVSKAHIVLYVMNASNPIKDSHSDDLKWLFRDLNLLPRTIFVVGHFDDVADVADEKEYSRVLDVKKRDILQRLDSILNLTEKEKTSLKIVGVSANPFGQGLDHWKQNPDEFKQLSKIDSLRRSTTEVIEHNGRSALIVGEQKSIASDILGKHLPQLREAYNFGAKLLPKKDEEIRCMRKKLNNFDKDITEARVSLVDAINATFSNMYGEIKAKDAESMETFMQQEIGKDGCVLNAKIGNLVAKNTQAVGMKVQEIGLDFQSIQMGMSEYVLGITKKFAEGAKVFGTEEIVRTFATPVTVDSLKNLSVFDKIKRGLGFTGGLEKRALEETTKKFAAISSKLNFSFAVLGALGEAISWYNESKRSEELTERKKKVTDALQELQRNYLKELGGKEEFARNFFPDSFVMKDVLEHYSHDMQLLMERQKVLEQLIHQGEIIDAEFKEI